MNLDLLKETQSKKKEVRDLVDGLLDILKVMVDGKLNQVSEVYLLKVLGNTIIYLSEELQAQRKQELDLIDEELLKTTDQKTIDGLLKVINQIRKLKNETDDLMKTLREVIEKEDKDE